MTYDPRAEWSVLRDVLLEHGFEAERIDKMMEERVYAWIIDNLGHVAQFSIDQKANHIFDYNHFGDAEPYLAPISPIEVTVKFIGGRNIDALRKLMARWR